MEKIKMNIDCDLTVCSAMAAREILPRDGRRWEIERLEVDELRMGRAKNVIWNIVGMEAGFKLGPSLIFPSVIPNCKCDEYEWHLIFKDKDSGERIDVWSPGA